MSIAEELGRLAELHKSGILTDDEFQQAKNALLNSNNNTDAQTSDHEGSDASAPTSNSSTTETEAVETAPAKNILTRRNILILVLVIVCAVTAFIVLSPGPKSPSYYGKSSSSDRSSIEPSCTVNGFGTGRCEFMNNGSSEGKICIKATIKQKLGYRSSSTTTLCSGIVAPGDMRERTLIISVPRDLCKTSSHHNSWTDVCDLVIDEE